MKNTNTETDKFMDFIFSVILLVLSIVIIGASIYMIFDTGNIAVYSSPGVFPLFIGTVIFILSIFLVIKNRQYCKRFNSDSLKKYKTYIIRLFIALISIFIYVFVLIRFVHFYPATFIYLCGSMIMFRNKNFPIFKIFIIATLATFVIGWGFGKLAGVPLP